MNKAVLNDWFVTAVILMTPGGIASAVLAGGVVEGHPRLADGEEITTSSVEEINMREKWLRTQNTLYSLGEPRKDWIEWMQTNGHDLKQFEDAINEASAKRAAAKGLLPN